MTPAAWGLAVGDFCKRYREIIGGPYPMSVVVVQGTPGGQPRVFVG